ncbi:hypothetical protein [Mesorhizobium sp. M7A.F.Ca.US.006.04.2.1]|uniref:hypothetical protein n=1 Tax=Mesorhizobium sp. M7A.F.Ca.US.006.04.2.1 TaxID=2496696 RepID=UPI0013E3316C|nr:hypothetical protein [Mesorhizobium sp. M7A.F.Ca.US.006.04.2.1]
MIAVLLGIVAYGEEVGLIDVTGMAVMLSAAFLALRERKQDQPILSPSQQLVAAPPAP